jgi:hypothetical protein
MDKHPRKTAGNVVCLPLKMRKWQAPSRDLAAAVGSPRDPRVQEAMRLIGSFLAIEDAAARAALIALADSLVTCDWARNHRRR